MSLKRTKSQSPRSCSQPPSRSGAKTETEKKQYKRFLETARILGCDEDEKAFEEKLKRIATAKPLPKTATKKPSK